MDPNMLNGLIALFIASTCGYGMYKICSATAGASPKNDPTFRTRAADYILFLIATAAMSIAACLYFLLADIGIVPLGLLILILDTGSIIAMCSLLAIWNGIDWVLKRIPAIVGMSLILLAWDCIVPIIANNIDYEMFTRIAIEPGSLLATATFAFGGYIALKRLNLAMPIVALCLFLYASIQGPSYQYVMISSQNSLALSILLGCKFALWIGLTRYLYLVLIDLDLLSKKSGRAVFSVFSVTANVVAAIAASLALFL